MDQVKLFSEPQLTNPSLLAAWPGMGGVAAIATTYLKDQLHAEEFGKIEPYEFFEPGVVEIRDKVLQPPQFAQSRFYSWTSGDGHDLIIFISEAQPPSRGYLFANEVLDVAAKFGVKRIYTTAASPAHVYYAKRPRVLGAATSADLIPELLDHGVRPMRSGSITGMNGVLLGIARERGMEGICLLGEMPIYMTQVTNPRAARAVIEALSRFLGLKVDLGEMDGWAKKMDAEIEKNIFQLMNNYADDAQKLVNYFERLKEQAASEEEPQEEGLTDVNSEELLKEVESFLKKQRGGEGEEKG